MLGFLLFLQLAERITNDKEIAVNLNVVVKSEKDNSQTKIDNLKTGKLQLFTDCC